MVPGITNAQGSQSHLIYVCGCEFQHARPEPVTLLHRLPVFGCAEYRGILVSCHLHCYRRFTCLVWVLIIICLDADLGNENYCFVCLFMYCFILGASREPVAIPEPFNLQSLNLPDPRTLQSAARPLY